MDHPGMDYQLQSNIAIVTLDDGKANVVGHNFQDGLNSALDRAQQENASGVILRGREGMFSAGFDLGEFRKGPEAGMAMVTKGMQLLIRMYSFPLPLVAACTGHAIAMGAFILMACDTRIGTRGNYKITLPETAIGMELPPLLLELTTSRIAPQFITRAAIQSEVCWMPTHSQWHKNWRNYRKSSTQLTNCLCAKKPCMRWQTGWKR
jgi:enoyl-CoA hydratase